MTFNHVRIPCELYKLPLTGIFEMSIIALAYNFDNSGGLRMSNGKLAEVLKTSSRTVERVIARLRKQGLLEDVDIETNNRCLKITTDIMSGLHTDTVSGKLPTSGGVTTDTTADHKERKKEKDITTGGRACGEGTSFSKTSSQTPQVFETFWQAYPSKVAKKAALKSWRKLAPDQRLFDEIMAALELHKQQASWHKENGRYIPKPSNWLSDERWKDEITDPQAEPDYSAALARYTHDCTEEEAAELMKEVSGDN